MARNKKKNNQTTYWIRENGREILAALAQNAVEACYTALLRAWQQKRLDELLQMLEWSPRIVDCGKIKRANYNSSRNRSQETIPTFIHGEAGIIFQF